MGEKPTATPPPSSARKARVEADEGVDWDKAMRVGTTSCPNLHGASIGRPGGPAMRQAGVFSLSRVFNSPDWNISVTMSQPPMNSPFTYSCGIVGQLE